MTDWMPAGRLNQRIVGGQGQLFPGRHERHIARRQKGMDLVVVSIANVNDLTALPLVSQPFEIDTEGVAAEFEEQHFLRLLPAAYLLSAAQPGDVCCCLLALAGCIP